MIMPNLDRERFKRMKPFEENLIAHRGLFNNKDIPENCLKGFKKAVEHDYGIELDVQRTTDGKLVVFHDATLKRICGIDRKLTDCSYDELMEYSLLDTEEKIPLFKDVLDALKEDTPLIVEIKPEGDCIGTCEEAVKMLNTYKRTWIMESFNPMVVRYLKKNHPEVIRGQLAYNLRKDKENCKNPFAGIALCYILTNFLTRPDFTAYDIRNYKNLSFQLISKVFKGECVAWTIRSEEDLALAKKYYQQYIFDSFVPKGHK